MKHKALFKYTVIFLAVIAGSIIAGSFYMLDFALKPQNRGRDIEGSCQYMYSQYPHLKPWADSLKQVHALKDTFIQAKDGTMLHVARQVFTLGVPMLGVNVGTKGFMADIEPEDLALVKRAAAGEYQASERMLLDVMLVRAAGDTFCACALNFVLERGLAGLTDADLAAMLRFANTAAYLVTTKKGAIKAMPTPEQVETTMARAQKDF